MSSKETSDHLRKWVQGEFGFSLFAWPTDACGYSQHINFIKHRNRNWEGGSFEDFKIFVLKYAEALEKV